MQNYERCVVYAIRSAANTVEWVRDFQALGRVRCIRHSDPFANFRPGNAYGSAIPVGVGVARAMGVANSRPITVECLLVFQARRNGSYLQPDGPIVASQIHRGLQTGNAFGSATPVGVGVTSTMRVANSSPMTIECLLISRRGGGTRISGSRVARHNSHSDPSRTSDSDASGSADPGRHPCRVGRACRS